MRTVLVRDDAGAIEIARQRGVVVPPLFEEVRDALGTQFRRMAMGWVVTGPDRAPRGYVILFASADGEDWEIMADGGWCISGARELFRFIFTQQHRVSARCKAVNFRNIRALQRMGFVIEGRKRLVDGDVINFGMLRDECRLIGRA